MGAADADVRLRRWLDKGRLDAVLTEDERGRLRQRLAQPLPSARPHPPATQPRRDAVRASRRGAQLMLSLRICAGWLELLLLTLLFPFVQPYLVAREAARSDESRAQVTRGWRPDHTPSSPSRSRGRPAHHQVALPASPRPLRAQVLLLLRRGMLLALLLATWPFVAIYLIARKLARALSACGPGAADARDNAVHTRRARARSPRRSSPPPSGRPRQSVSPSPQRKSQRRRRSRTWTRRPRRTRNLIVARCTVRSTAPPPLRLTCSWRRPPLRAAWQWVPRPATSRQGRTEEVMRPP